MSLYITDYVSFSFGAAHLLEFHKGKCKNLHGHTWKVEIWISMKRTDMGTKPLVWDFTYAKQIKKQFDHKFLNDELDVFKTMPPTAENIAVVIYDIVSQLFVSDWGYYPSNLIVRVWESDHSYAEVKDHDNIS